MMSNNKILTVSYGTFSCTLEGFDDSFGTMKAIAEYFRDLASDDRYFGAEPPQPDAEMLARIAQKEISRRVEAREHEGKIVLSAVEEPTAAPALTAAAAATVAATAAVAQTPAQDEAPVVAERSAEAPVEDTSEPADAEHAPLTDADEEIYQEPELDPDYEAAQAERAALHDHDEDDNADDSADPVAAETAEEGVAEAEPEAETVAEDDAPEQEAAQDAYDEPDASSALVAPITMLGKDLGDTEIEVDIVPGQPDAEVEAFFANSPSTADAYEETTAETDNTPAPVAEPVAADNIADKLQRIRAVVAQNDPDEDLYEQERLAAEREEEAAAQAAGTDGLVSDALRDITSALNEDDESELAAAEAAALDAELVEDSEEELAPEVPKDHIAALLSRLDESRAEQAKAETEETAETPDAALDAVEQDIETLADEAAPETAETETGETELANLFDEDTSDALADQEPEQALDDEDDFDLSAAIGDLTAQPELEVETAQTEEPAAPKARVIKVKRVDLAAAVAKGQLEEVVDAEDAPSSTLSPAEEDELARELAAVEAELAGSIPQADDADTSLEAHVAEMVEAEDDYTAGDYSNDIAAELDEDDLEEIGEEAVEETATAAENAAARPLGTRNDFPQLDEASQSSDMNRLMAETESQMGEPEGATRRNAFAALRAAVAAKKADDAMGGSDTGVNEDDAYRTDLAEVVRPRRPTTTPEPAQRTQRPGAKRNGPLKLVAEQRIDPEVADAAPAPVRPRRVISRDLNAEAPAQSGFAAFVAEQGATKLPEILEAAASYLSFVEGRDQFSRPQLMSKVRELEPDEFTREEGLRSFGQLLRAGKIEKIKGGRFTVSQDIGYRPTDTRAAG